MKLKTTLFLVVMLCFTDLFAQEKIKGQVFFDANKNGTLDRGESGLSEIKVSNGVDIVETDQKGKFALERIGHLPIFVIKPTGYQFTSIHLGQPLFYECKEIIKDGTLQFGLQKQNEDNQLRVALLGDTQPHNIDEVYYTLRAMDELKTKAYDFSVALGDVVSDNPVLLPLVKEVIAATGKMSHFTFGNHDLSWDSLAVHGLDYWDRDWIRVVGPTYYAMSWGATNFISMNDINVKWNDAKNKYDYDYFMKPDQLSFIRNYLSYLNKDDLLVITSHSKPNSINNREEFYELFEGFSNVLFVFGHHHRTDNYLIDKSAGWPNENPAHCIGAGAICGGHWRGEEDMFGIPSATMVDGTPKGYAFLNIDSGNYTIEYKATGMDDEKQLHIYSPDHLTYDTNFSPANDTIGGFYANVYLGGEESLVEYRIDDGEWNTMKKVDAADPYLKRVMMRQKLGVYPTDGARKLKRDFDTMEKCTHLWKATYPTDLSYGVHYIQVRFEDPHLDGTVEKHSFIHLSPYLKKINKELDLKYKGWVDSQ